MLLGLRCDNVPPSHFVTFAEEKQSLHGTETGYHPFTLLQPFPALFFLCHILQIFFSFFLPYLPLFLSIYIFLKILYPLSCTSTLLSNRLLSGHASDPSVIFLYAFYLKFISDFVIIYLLIYLDLLMHAVCETDSCIY